GGRAEEGEAGEQGPEEVAVQGDAFGQPGRRPSVRDRDVEQADAAEGRAGDREPPGESERAARPAGDDGEGVPGDDREERADQVERQGSVVEAGRAERERREQDQGDRLREAEGDDGPSAPSGEPAAEGEAR